jgi:hypothetical protein
MAHCYICDKGIDEVKIDPRDGKTRPCAECEAISQECLAEMDKDHVFNQIDDDTVAGFGVWDIPNFMKDKHDDNS